MFRKLAFDLSCAAVKKTSYKNQALRHIPSFGLRGEVADKGI
jgi:hypothetical protein